MIDNVLIRIYVNKIENRITFSLMIGYYLKLLTPEKIKFHLFKSFRLRIFIY